MLLRGVVIPSKVRPGARRSTGRGFSLLELMVVVVIIGIIVMLAVPSMTVAGNDRHAYNDAGSIMMLFRAARTRAVARGTAVLVSMTANGASDRGTFLMYEAVVQNAIAGGGGGGTAESPVSTCKAPTVWNPLPTPNAPIAAPGAGANGVNLVDGVNLNNSGIEAQADIQTSLWIYQGSATPVGFNAGFICYTPLGHTYVQTTGGVPDFNGVLPTVSPIEARVKWSNGGMTRSVLIPPNGMARVFSHT